MEEDKEIPLSLPLQKGEVKAVIHETPPLVKGARGISRVLQEFMPFDQILKGRARELRSAMTNAENKIWSEILKQKKLLGYIFLRQKPLGHFIVDFYCHQLSLVIEIDGDSHVGSEERDEQRTKFLENMFGLKIIRYTNLEVLLNLDFVKNDLEEFIKQQNSPRYTP